MGRQIRYSAKALIINNGKMLAITGWCNPRVVVCPECGKAGIVHFDKEHYTALFQCESCYTKKKMYHVETMSLK